MKTERVVKASKIIAATLLFLMGMSVAQAEDTFYIVGENMRLFGVHCLDMRFKPILGAIKFREYFDDGKYAIGECQNGVLEGIFKVYDESGKLKQEMLFKNGEMEGIAKAYYESGKLKGEASYKNGKQEGEMSRYRENGKLFVTIIYKNDVPVSGVCHHTGGGATRLSNAELTNWENGHSGHSGHSIECE